MIGPRPCAYSCAYVDPVFTSTRITSLNVFLVLMLMSIQFSLAYACACAYAYALVKTRLYCDLVKMRYTYWLWAACWASLHKPFRKPFGWCIWDTPPLFETGILVASQVSWSWRISSLSRCLPLPDQPTGKLYGTIYLNEINICKSKLSISSDLVTKNNNFFVSDSLNLLLNSSTSQIWKKKTSFAQPFLILGPLTPSAHYMWLRTAERSEFCLLNPTSAPSKKSYIGEPLRVTERRGYNVPVNTAISLFLD